MNGGRLRDHTAVLLFRPASEVEEAMFHMREVCVREDGT